uniref:KaiC-like domain-containing protein n=1 Tax=Ignisphaera aggregans TaxID=334771 RepID=A0A7C2Z8J6_9CREN
MYLRIPVSRDVESIVEMINNVLTSWKPMVIVVDSINVLMENVEDPNKRAWLQNYFYSLSEIINGVAVLIAEIPLGGAVIGLGSIEFVADAVIILKHRIEGGLLARTMEIRKMRGAPITISEFPFTITAKKGIEVFIPPILAEIRKPGR